MELYLFVLSNTKWYCSVLNDFWNIFQLTIRLWRICMRNNQSICRTVERLNASRPCNNRIQPNTDFANFFHSSCSPSSNRVEYFFMKGTTTTYFKLCVLRDNDSLALWQWFLSFYNLVIWSSQVILSSSFNSNPRTVHTNSFYIVLAGRYQTIFRAHSHTKLKRPSINIQTIDPLNINIRQQMHPNMNNSPSHWSLQHIKHSS